MNRHLIASITLHIGLLLFIVWHGYIDPKAINLNQPKPNLSVVELSNEPPLKEESKKRILEAIPGGDEPCKKYYYGVGFTHGKNIIDDVIEGYPAHKVGVRTGDIIVYLDIPNLNNVRAKLTVLRNDQVLNFEFITTKICISE